MRLAVPLAVLAILLALGPPAHAAIWRRPVSGPVVRAFAYGPDPFRRGLHRGVDLAAPPGAVVRAACTGMVVTARAVAPAGGVVTLRCGRWRVTHLPLVALSVRRGEVVGAGERVGRLAASDAHAGLHLGVRRADDRFGYVDPMRFLGKDGHAAPPIPVVPGGKDLGRPPPPAPPAAPRPVPVPAQPAGVPAAPRPDRPASAADRAGRGGGAGALAPWPAWAGLALVLCGAIGSGLELGRRRRRASRPVAACEGVR